MDSYLDLEYDASHDFDINECIKEVAYAGYCDEGRDITRIAYEGY